MLLPFFFVQALMHRSRVAYTRACGRDAPEKTVPRTVFLNRLTLSAPAACRRGQSAYFSGTRFLFSASRLKFYFSKSFGVANMLLPFFFVQALMHRSRVAYTRACGRDAPEKTVPRTVFLDRLTLSAPAACRRGQSAYFSGARFLLLRCFKIFENLI